MLFLILAHCNILGYKMKVSQQILSYKNESSYTNKNYTKGVNKMATKGRNFT